MKKNQTFLIKGTQKRFILWWKTFQNKSNVCLSIVYRLSQPWGLITDATEDSANFQLIDIWFHTFITIKGLIRATRRSNENAIWPEISSWEYDSFFRLNWSIRLLGLFGSNLFEKFTKTENSPSPKRFSLGSHKCWPILKRFTAYEFLLTKKKHVEIKI